MEKKRDIAGRAHWDEVYDKIYINNDFEWKPDTYCEKLVESMLIPIIEKYRPNSIMEIGCGNSNWLPYIAEKYKIAVYGIDYSEQGCSLLQKKIDSKYHSNIFCVDFFDTEKMKNIPKVDMIFSLGVIEHFTCPEEVLSIFSNLLNENGILFTEVPNLGGINGWISKIYQPKVYKMHVIHTVESLKNLYEKIDFNCLKCEKVGQFTFELVAWGSEPRFPSIDRYIQYIVFRFLVNRKPKKINTEAGPFIYIVGKRRE